jgi:hypothetical protein
MELTITLTDEQAEIIKDEIQTYAETLANDRLAQKAENEKAERVKAFLSLPTDEQIATIAASSRPSYEPMEGGA